MIGKGTRFGPRQVASSAGDIGVSFRHSQLAADDVIVHVARSALCILKIVGKAWSQKMDTTALTPEATRALSTETLARLRRLQSWDLAHVRARVCEQRGWESPYSIDVESEYKKFLSLAIVSPDKRFGMAGDVDEIWHQHILDTEDYARMCNDVVGSFVHHCPNRVDAGPQTPCPYENETLPSLRRLYGRELSPVWPTDPGAIHSVSKCCSTHG